MRLSLPVSLGPPAAQEGHWLAKHLPSVFSQVHLGPLQLWQLFGIVLAVGVGWTVGLGLGSLLTRVGRGIASRTKVEWDDDLIAQMRGPTRTFIGLLVLWALIQLLALAAPVQLIVNYILRTLLIANVAWFAARFVRFVGDTVERTATEQSAGQEGAELRVRGVQTQVRVLRRVASIIILIVAVALMLVQFQVVRTVGMSLLASAGIAGIVIGLAAQKSIANLLAGIQLSITQPVRIGDTVIVDGEWGQIEEINLTYVVLRVWDQRRLIVPISQILEKPFQNWTKTSTELLGTVYIYADYAIPVDAVRQELDRILDGNPNFDGRAKGVAVTDATERTVQLRPLVSAKNSGDLWNLRCEVREKLIAWLQHFEGGKYLPRTRIEAPDIQRPGL